jgi:hypothetical protein
LGFNPLVNPLEAPKVGMTMLGLFTLKYSVALILEKGQFVVRRLVLNYGKAGLDDLPVDEVVSSSFVLDDVRSLCLA